MSASFTISHRLAVHLFLARGAVIRWSNERRNTGMELVLLVWMQQCIGECDGGRQKGKKHFSPSQGKPSSLYTIFHPLCPRCFRRIYHTSYFCLERGFIQEGEKGGGIKESGTELRIPVTISISDSQRRKCDDCFILLYFLSFQLFLDFLKSDFLWTFFTLGEF